MFFGVSNDAEMFESRNLTDFHQNFEDWQT
jgi:hypothetical protein